MKTCSAMLLCLLLAASVAVGETSFSLLTNGRGLDGRLGFSEPNGVIESGLVVGWDRDQPEHLWKVGGYGFLTVTPNAELPVANWLPGVGDWLGLPETVKAELKLGGEVAVVNLAHDAKAAGGPIIEAEVGPLLFDFVWRFVENSSVPAYDGPWFVFGLKPIRF